MINRIKKHTISFQHAFAGMILSFKTQPNYQIHFALSFLALTGSFMFKISYYEFLIIVCLIFIGLTIETVNTALENTNNAIDQNIREDIRIAKDAAAGAMLIYALGAFTIACIIFIPKILSLIIK